MRIARQCLGSGAVVYLEQQIERAPFGEETGILNSEDEVMNRLATAYQIQRDCKGLARDLPDLEFAPPPDPWTEYLCLKGKQ